MPVPTLTLHQPQRLLAQGGMCYWHGWVARAALCPQALASLAPSMGAQGACSQEERQEVFVKGTLEGAGSALIVPRLEHEYQVMCQIQHPGVARVLACTPTQLCFEWLPGDTLREYLTAHGPLSAAQAAEVLRVLLDVLVYLHARGIVHHDIKPENIMLPIHWPKPLVGQWGVVLVDFGMAYSAALPDIHAWARMGTPHYMAPEQFQGVRGDPRSDLFSVGALLFDMLCASPPHPDAMGWLAGYNTAALPLPAPAAFHPLLRSALARDPDQRPQSAQQMLQMVEAACKQL